MKKIRVDVNAECANKTAGLVQGGVKIMAILPTGQGAVLTNQCLEEEMLSEGLRNPSVLTDSDNFIVRENQGGLRPGFRYRG
jgi:hypothetical protein